MAKNKLLKNATTVMAFSLIAKFSSFLVELLVASNLGANEETDAFYMVYGIVQIVYPMISIGIWKVFLPEYKTRKVLNNEEGANRITNQLIVIFGCIALTIIAITCIFPKAVILIFAPGFQDNVLNISAGLLRIVVFIIVFNISTTFSSAILQSHDKFTKSQVKEIIVHLPSLLYLLFSRGKCNITGLALSVTVGAVLASISASSLRRKYYKFRFPKKLIDADIKRILKLVPVACLNSIINQLNSVFDKVFASTLPAGSVTYLNYGSKLIHLFDGLFSTAISTALFPYLTELVAKSDYDKLKKFIKNYIVLISMTLLPISSIILLFSNEIVQIVFGHGKFNHASVNMTAMVLLMYGLGLLLMCLTTIVNDVFYILKRTKILLWTTVANIISNVILDFAFVHILGVVGLALATTLSLLVALIIKFIYIRDLISFDRELFKHLVMILLYCCMSSLASVTLMMHLSLSVLPKTVVGVLAFGIIYIIFALILDKEMRNTIMLTIENFSKGGTSNKRKLKADIRLDRENNSTKSYIILYFYRKMHALSLKKHHKIRIKLWTIFKEVVFFFIGVNAQISYKAEIGRDIRLLHSGIGVVISAKAIIGDHQTIYHQVTIGINENKPIGQQKIIIHDNCYLSAGCKIISCEIGEGCKIGPNAVVYKDLPAHSIYVASNQLL